MRALGSICGVVALLVSATAAAAQETLVIRGGTVHTLAGSEFVGTVVVQDGRIAAVGPNASAPAGAEVIDASGLHVYPGLFDAVSSLGLTEIGAVDVTDDTEELGNFVPHLQARTAVHPASEHIPVARANGITHTLAVPAGADDGGFPGQGSLIHLDGWTVEEMDIVPGAAFVMTWPSLQQRRFGFGRFGGPSRARGFDQVREEYERAVDRIARWLETARDYERAVAAGEDIPRDLRLEALARVANGEAPVLAMVDDERDIRNVVEFAQEEGLRLIIAGGAEAYKVADLLADNDIPVILGPTQSMPPSGADGRYDEAYANPGMLHAAGVKIAFATFNSSDSRTLPYEAAMSIGYGLPRDVALRAITINAAEMLGVGDRLGTIEPGKIANLIVTDGDPLEIQTQIRHVIIAGRDSDLMNKHLELYQKYRSRPVSSH